MSSDTAMPPSGARVLGVGIDEAIGATAQDELRRAGLRATVITVTDDEAGDELLLDALGQTPTTRSTSGPESLVRHPLRS